MLPRVIIHSGISVDGRMDFGIGDIGLYYGLAERFGAEAMLSGSETILAAYDGRNMLEGEAEPPSQPPAGKESHPWLVVVDSHGRINNWAQIRREPYWRDVIVLCSRVTPRDHLEKLRMQNIPLIIAGEEHVDLRSALEELNTGYGVQILRVDSGGRLNGALLRAGLVNEVSLIFNPCLVGGTTPSSVFVAPDLTSNENIIPVKLVHMELLDGGAVWLKYEVSRQ